MKLRKKPAMRILCTLLIFSLLLGTPFCALDLETESTTTPVQRSDIAPYLRENRPGGLVGFEGDYALAHDGQMVSVIVEFLHQPADLEKALAKLSRARGMFNETAAEQAAEQDQQDFRAAMDALTTAPLHMGGSGTAPSYTITATYTLGINGVAVTLPNTSVEALLAMDCVYAVYPDRQTPLDYLDAEAGGHYQPYPPTAGPGATSTATTADPTAIGMYDSRELLDLNHLHNSYTGAGVTVAVIDSGIDYNHPDFAGAFDAFSKTLPNGTPTPADALLNGRFYGRNYVDNGRPANDPMDDHGHGTHCAGIVGGRGLNRPNSTLGVAPGVNFVSYKVLDETNSYLQDSTLFEGMEGAVKDGFTILSMSVGTTGERGPCASTALFTNNLVIARPDVVFVVCAGNSGPDDSTLWVPSTSALVLTVANAQIPAPNKSIALHRTNSTSNMGDVRLGLIRNSWIFQTSYVEEKGCYSLRDTPGSNMPQLLANEDGSYNMVYISTADGSAAGTGTKAELDAYITAHNADALKGALLVLARGQNFDTSVYLSKTYGFGGIIVTNTEDRDFGSISFAQGPFRDYIPVFTTDYSVGQELTRGLTPGSTTKVSVNGIYALGETALYDSSSRGPVTSTYEIKPDITAPGTSILSVMPDFDGTNDYTYAYQSMTGTSMATPHIAGMVALLRQQNPNITLEEIRARLMNTSESLGFGVYEEGAGMANPTKALAADCYATATNHFVSTRTENNVLSWHNVETGSLSFGVVAQGLDGNVTLPITVHNKSTAARTFQIAVNPTEDLAGVSVRAETASVTVPAGGSTHFNVTAHVAKTAGIGLCEGAVLLSNAGQTLRLPFAVSVQAFDQNAPLFDADNTFLQVNAISNGDKQQISKISNYTSADSIFHYRFNNDYPAYRCDIAKGDGTLIGVADSYWYTDTSKGDDWYYSNLVTGRYAPATFDANGVPTQTSDTYVDLPEGHYKLVVTGFGSTLLKDKSSSFDFYVDNTLPILNLSRYTDGSNIWQYTRDGDNAVLNGNVLDAGTTDMMKLGLNQGINKKLNNADTSQNDNIVVLKAGETYYRAEIQANGDFTITLPATALTEKATLYYGDHFLPVGISSNRGFGSNGVEGFHPEKLSYTAKKSVEGVPYMNHFAYRAANMNHIELALALYTSSGGSSSGGSSGSGTSSLPTTPPVPSTNPTSNTTLAPTATVKDGVASSTLTNVQANQLVDDAKKNQSSQVILAPALPTGTTASKVGVQLPLSAVSALASGTKSALVLETSVATITLPNQTLSQISGKTGTQVEISAAKNNDGSFSIYVGVDGTALQSLTRGIKVSIPNLKAGATAVAALVLPDGTRQIIRKSATANNDMLVLLDGSSNLVVFNNATSFSDTEPHWSKNAVAFATSHELFRGTSDTVFSPDAPMTRGMLVTVLNRLEQEAQSSTPTSFGDVKSGDYYANAVAWAAEHKIVNGTSENSFSPTLPITREQLAVLLFRYANTFGYDTTTKGSTTPFSDANRVSDWAQSAMDWAVGTGLISGKNGNLLDPSASASRAEVATMMQRFLGTLLA